MDPGRRDRNRHPSPVDLRRALSLRIRLLASRPGHNDRSLPERGRLRRGGRARATPSFPGGQFRQEPRSGRQLCCVCEGEEGVFAGAACSCLVAGAGGECVRDPGHEEGEVFGGEFCGGGCYVDEGGGGGVEEDGGGGWG